MLKIISIVITFAAQLTLWFSVTTCECSEGRHEVDQEETNPYASVEGMKDMLRNTANRRMPLNDQVVRQFDLSK